jgi:hypothetical protein
LEEANQTLQLIYSPSLAYEAQVALSTVHQLSPVCYLPLIDSSLSSMKDLSPADYADFKTLLSAFTEQRKTPCWFHYSALTLLHLRLENHFHPEASKHAVIYHDLIQVLPFVHTVLGSFAYLQSTAHLEIQQAFMESCGRLNLVHEESLLPAPGECSPPHFDNSLNHLRCCAMELRTNIVFACGGSAGRGTGKLAEQRELLQVVREYLDPGTVLSEVPVPTC